MHKLLSFIFLTLLGLLGHILVHGAPATPAADVAQDSSFFKDLYGTYFDGLDDSWDSQKGGSMASPSIQAAFVQSKSASTATSFPTNFPPYTGPGIELAPSPVPTEPGSSFNPSKHPYASGLHKLIVVFTVVGIIGVIMLCCFLINERRILCSCGRRKGALDSSPERERDKAQFRTLKHKLLMSELDKGSWTKMPISERCGLLVSPPSPGGTSTDDSEGSDGLDSPSLMQEDGVTDDCCPDYPKSKWSMTISDYAISPRASTATAAARRALHASAHVPQPPISVSPPQAAYLRGSERTLSDYPPVWRYGHVRNQSAPVTPSIASSVSEATVEGRSRSSSTSSGRAVRVRWK